MSAHPHGERFDFELPPNTAVFTCARVRDGAPILYVSHDGDGDWQFLCGGDHENDGPDGCVLACLGCVVTRDPSLNEVATLSCDEVAVRESPSSGWTLRDTAMERIEDAIANVGWAVQLIGAGDSDDEPEFAYTVGLYESFEHPELILFGLPHDRMHRILNLCGERIANGEPLRFGEPIHGLVPSHPLRVRPVEAWESYRAHVGYAIAHYERRFPLAQLLWPDREGTFPDDANAATWLTERQPLLR